MSPVRSNSAPGPSVSSSRLIALIMRHGDADGQSATAQQRIFWGMNRRLAREGYHGVFLDLSDTTTENAARDAEHLRYVVDQGFAGAVFYAEAFRHNRELIQETAERLPLVLVDRLVPGVRTDFVGVDNFGAMHAATRHLLELGHRRLLYITNAEPIHTVQDRLNGFRQALQEIARPPLSEHIVTAIADWSVAEWPVFDGFFRQAADQRPTAILCVNDYTAALAYGRLRTLGLSVPKDVSLCGFDDVIPLLPNGIGLTTMAQPFEQIGRSAAERILAHRAIAAAPAPAFLELPARLIPRTSTAPPADADRKSPAPNSILAQQTT